MQTCCCKYMHGECFQHHAVSFHAYLFLALTVKTLTKKRISTGRFWRRFFSSRGSNPRPFDVVQSLTEPCCDPSQSRLQNYQLSVTASSLAHALLPAAHSDLLTVYTGPSRQLSPQWVPRTQKLRSPLLRIQS